MEGFNNKSSFKQIYTKVISNYGYFNLALSKNTINYYCYDEFEDEGKNSDMK